MILLLLLTLYSICFYASDESTIATHDSSIGISYPMKIKQGFALIGPHAQQEFETLQKTRLHHIHTLLTDNDQAISDDQDEDRFAYEYDALHQTAESFIVQKLDHKFIQLSQAVINHTINPDRMVGPVFQFVKDQPVWFLESINRYRSHDGLPLLGCAINKGHIAMAQLLIDLGVDVTTPIDNSQEPDYIIEPGCRISGWGHTISGIHPNENKKSSLLLNFAVQKNQVAIAESLLKKGCNSQKKDSSGKIAEIYVKSEAMRQLLIKYKKIS